MRHRFQLLSSNVVHAARFAPALCAPDFMLAVDLLARKQQLAHFASHTFLAKLTRS